MQLISPWSKGETCSLFVETVWGRRVVEERMAAPNTLLPDETPCLVRGMIWCSMVWRREDMRGVMMM